MVDVFFYNELIKRATENTYTNFSSFSMGETESKEKRCINV